MEGLRAAQTAINPFWQSSFLRELMQCFHWMMIQPSSIPFLAFPCALMSFQCLVLFDFSIALAFSLLISCLIFFFVSDALCSAIGSWIICRPQAWIWCTRKSAKSKKASKDARFDCSPKECLYLLKHATPAWKNHSWPAVDNNSRCAIVWASLFLSLH